MQKTNYTTWVVAVVVIVIALFFVFKHKAVVVPPVTTPETTVTTEPEGVQDTAGQSTGAASLSYADALVKYKDRRIQFNASCQASPRSVTYKDNTGIMLDNRSAQTRTIKVGATYTIKPYGFKIAVLPDIYLKSKTILVDCGSSQNVATVLVQE